MARGTVVNPAIPPHLRRRTVDFVELVRRVRQARKDMCFSQGEVAEALGVARTAVTNIESGKRRVSLSDLTTMSKLFHFPVEHLIPTSIGEKDEYDLHSLLHASPALRRDRAARKQIAGCMHLCNEGKKLKRIVGAQRNSVSPNYAALTRNGGDAFEQGEAVAAVERRRLKLGDAPVPNMRGLISSQGIWASCISLPADISCVYVERPSIGKAMFVNAGHALGRRRQAYAHEYAHVLFQKDRKLAISSMSNAGDPYDMRADAFAAAFLMPENGIAAILRNLNKGHPIRQFRTKADSSRGDAQAAVMRKPAHSQRITQLEAITIAYQFSVSYAAVLNRMLDLHYISKSEFEEHLCFASNEREYEVVTKQHPAGEDLEEPKTYALDLRSEIAGLAIEAYCTSYLTRRRLSNLAELLGVGHDGMLQQAEIAERNYA